MKGQTKLKQAAKHYEKNFSTDKELSEKFGICLSAARKAQDLAIDNLKFVTRCKNTAYNNGEHNPEFEL